MRVREDGRVGIVKAAELAGTNPTRLYVAFVRGHIEAVRENGRLYFLPMDLTVFRARVMTDAKRIMRELGERRGRANGR